MPSPYIADRCPPLPRSTAIALTALIAAAGCKPTTEPVASGSAEQFNLKDYLCVIAPVECNQQTIQKLVLASPDEKYETKLGNKALRIAVGYVSPLQLTPGRRAVDTLYLEANGPGVEPRTKDNLSDFFRQGPRPTLLRIRLLHHDDDGEKASKHWLSQVVPTRTTRVLSMRAGVKRYPDVYGLAHWGTDYVRMPSFKPCEREGEMQRCGMGEQDDLYVPVKKEHGGTWIECASWLYLRDSAAPKTVLMSVAERDGYYLSEKARKPQWRMSRDPHCRHSFFHEQLGSAVSVSYHLALLSEWRQIESRVRDLLDASKTGN